MMSQVVRGLGGCMGCSTCIQLVQDVGIAIYCCVVRTVYSQLTKLGPSYIGTDIIHLL